MLNLNDIDSFYDPYPILRAASVFEPGFYERLVECFPPQDLFTHLARSKDNKYTFTEDKNLAVLKRWVRQHEPLRAFFDYTRSEEFRWSVLDALRAKHVDLGIKRGRPSLLRQLRHAAGDVTKRHQRPRFERSIRTRFGFFMMPADGGFLAPHTDAADKFLTLVFSIMRVGEWDPSFGGGLEVERPKGKEHSFNHVNRYIGFDDVEAVRTIDFNANQCVIFIKTFNSYHAVRPMTGRGSSAMRRTIIVNFEYA